jgi:hypothetical protein
MEQQQSRQEEQSDIMTNSIQEFIEAARQYLFGMAPTQPALATIPVRHTP